MNVKTDTKEKFTVITLPHGAFTVNMTDEMKNLLLPYLQKDIPHLVVKMDHVSSIDEDAAKNLAQLQQQFYENNCSFVICGLQAAVEEKLDKLEFLEIMNVTPTESEAWDIVQMEEIERELLGGEEEDV
jgi:anti-anti-sigma factor